MCMQHLAVAAFSSSGLNGIVCMKRYATVQGFTSTGKENPPYRVRWKHSFNQGYLGAAKLRKQLFHIMDHGIVECHKTFRHCFALHVQFQGADTSYPIIVP